MYLKGVSKNLVGDKKVILHVVGRLDIGGAESRIMDLYHNIDKEKVQFVFCQHTTDRCAYEDEIKSMGGKVYYIPRFRIINFFSYKRAWQRFFEEHAEIDVVHGHMTSTASIYLPIAKRNGVSVTIAHARSAGTDRGLKGIATKIMRKKLWKKTDVMIACSMLAGRAVFGEQAMQQGKVRLFPNAIEVERFAYDAGIRKEVREKLKLQNSFVLGHVGRFSPVKNHEYLLKILKECIKLEEKQQLPQIKLMLLGDGELRENTERLANQMGIASRVLFLGNRRDIYRYYQAMDFFLLPSFYEGLPGTAIEAQASGLPGIISDTITHEAVITERFTQKDISTTARVWAEEIIRYMPAESMGRKGYEEKVRKAGFDVKEQVVRMQKFYLCGEWEDA